MSTTAAGALAVKSAKNFFRRGSSRSRLNGRGAAAGLEGLAGLINFRVGAWQDFGYENPPDSMCEDCPHGRTAHLTRAPSRPEPYFCSACECRQYRGPNDLERLAEGDADVTERRRQWRASLRGDAG